MIQLDGITKLRLAARNYDLARSAYSKSAVTLDQVMIARQAYLDAEKQYKRIHGVYSTSV
jgi:outer membrane protein TolC